VDAVRGAHSERFKGAAVDTDVRTTYDANVTVHIVVNCHHYRITQVLTYIEIVPREAAINCNGTYVIQTG